MAQSPTSGSDQTSDAESKRTKQRSPNYPALTFMSALEMARKVYDKDKKSPVAVAVVAKHLGFKNQTNGSAIVTISALKKYGLLVPAGDGLRVSDDAQTIFLFPADNPERQSRIKALAMRPQIFQDILQEFPDGLPSDENLNATLQTKWAFTSDAAANMIKVLRHATELVGNDRAFDVAESKASEDGVSPPLKSSGSPLNSSEGKATFLPQVDVKEPGSSQREKHLWKLGDGVWAELTISGKLSQRRLERLKQYVSLLDFDDESD